MPSEKSSLHLVDPELRPILDVFRGFDVSDETLPNLRNAPPPTPLDTPAYEEVFVPRKNSADALRPVSYTHLTLPTNREV